MIKAVIFDLDGTLYLGKTAIPGAQEKLDELHAKGIKTIMLTNAATRTRAGVVEKLSAMGITAEVEKTYCTSYFLAKYISENHPGKKAYVVGEQGIFDEFKEHEIETVSEGADLVVVGLDRTLTYEKLAGALKELNNGAELIASNQDVTFPTENGMRPGAGSILAAVEAASGKKAVVLGKPNTYACDLIIRDHGIGKEEMLMVGDRLDTDIMFANSCGIKSALLLSGVSKKDEIKEIKPDYVFESIAELNLP
jgi:HAD superfamily hydrolase (TIGR01457 family)